jgi:hypothetical protein
MARIHGLILDAPAGRIRAEKIEAFPVLRRSYGPPGKTTTTVRADIVQDEFRAGATKRAFKRTDHRFDRIWWQRHFAILANRSYFEHANFL